MSNKLLVSITALAIGVGVVSCGQNEEPASKQGGPAAPEAQQPRAEKQAEQPREEQGAEAEKRAKTENQAVAEKQAEAEQQAEAEKQKQAEAGQREQMPQQPAEQTGSERQAQQRQAQQTQQRNQPGQNQQATATPPSRPLNLTRDQVLEAQKLLNQKGFDIGEIDGVIGARTRRAVIAFQRQQGLQMTGQIDQRTASALGLSVAPSSITSGRSGTVRQ